MQSANVATVTLSLTSMVTVAPSEQRHLEILQQQSLNALASPMNAALPSQLILVREKNKKLEAASEIFSDFLMCSETGNEGKSPQRDTK